MTADNSAGPREFGPNDDASLELPTEGAYRVQEALRVMGWDPHHPRVFSQARGLLRVWLPLAAGSTWAGLSMILDSEDGFWSNLVGYSFYVFVMGLAIWLVIDVSFHRYGVDHDKVWTRFGPFHREIRFTDITRLDIGIEHYKIWAGKTKINIGYHRYDYALVHLQLVEQIRHHHIRLPDTDITDPNWDKEAQIWRNILAAMVYREHRDFYDTHPQHLAQLNTLIGPPDHYDD
ncbi:hypothetical protein JMX53_05565 [Cutibacterium avidum]|uniref:hypothetical protein n=1 Tax=Cutibacterium avidum TaxID=33010 RepID=UPI00192B7FCE|nr:hypothetical protein [Cutibacterium avidum]QQY15968.1 hypothetical protein JMX53_05565 [Cutibacterium avidum]